MYVDDDPWRRLPWVLSAALLVWGALLWTFGFLLGQLDTQPQIPNSIDAQFIEVRSSGMQHEKSKPIRKPPAPTIVPASADKTVSPTAHQPDVPQVEANARPSEQAAQSAAGSNDAGVSPQTNTASNTPPQFGAAYLNNPKPAYPPFARRMRFEGTVLLKVLVSHEGTVLSLEEASSPGHEISDKAASEAVRKWRFIPASRAFHPIDEWVQVPVAFHLNN